MAKTTMLCLLGNIALQSGNLLRWDAQKQDVANHSDVKHCISYEREYRKPWKHHGLQVMRQPETMNRPYCARLCSSSHW
jgi:hypothetical protein